MAQINGFIPYGSDDSSVIFRRNLRARPTNAGSAAGDVGTCTATDEGTGATYDPVKGLICTTNNDIILSAINGSSASMDTIRSGGQIYFEVETALLACDSATSEYSSGGVTRGNERVFALMANPGPNGYYETGFQVTSGKLISATTGYGTNLVLGTSSWSDAIGAGEFVPVVIANTGKDYTVYVNDVFFRTLSRLNTVPLGFDKIYLSRYPVAAPAQWLVSGHIRNLQISDRPLTFAGDRNLRTVTSFGDSYANATGTYISPFFNLEKALNMRSRLNAKGWDYGSYTNSPYGGRRVIGTDGTWNKTDAAGSYLAPNCATMLAARPSTVIFQAGANDLTQTGSMSQMDFEASVKGFVEQCFGLNGNAATDVLRVVLCTTPWAPQYPDAAQAELRKPDVTKIRNAIFSIPIWFDSTYPALAGRVSVADVFSAFGGFNADPTYYAITDLLHPGPKGHYVMGSAWGNALLNLVST